MLSWQVDIFATTPFTNKQITKFGNSQIEFISATHDANDKTSVFLASDYLWELRLKDGELKIDEVLFDDFRMVMLQAFYSYASPEYFQGVCL